MLISASMQGLTFGTVMLALYTALAEDQVATSAALLTNHFHSQQVMSKIHPFMSDNGSHL